MFLKIISLIAVYLDSTPNTPYKNMAYFLKCKEAAAKAGINPPEAEEVEYTNFIH